ncbi:hypothetical protein HXX76_000654 [Chlamydomonas incerta]|uniref:Glycosyl hydrolase family 32 N-terminal domain-containing protein n=1 Tax=Chlamydomonas incerta TaxID=51695 RepID=A0A835WEN7_CHLIN|nr:hypothetical protein HXX76_000654 [Chlamydomonas incerta]|eukprot:KAG2446052.1 hypothetical protein HXX76_000654 [Chlamydomonas incerta]
METGCQWSWGLMWGHAVSRDLVTWEHLPPALAPSFGGFDGDGCFSGCATLDENGVPTILYTGVRLRSSEVCGPLPPPECDLGTACIETQCTAYADPADPKLTYWTKEEIPFLALPPPNMQLTAWRDPFVIGRPGQDGQAGWTVMIGAGVRDRGGTALVYRSPSLRAGPWTYVGELCRGAGDTGVIWECPVMLHPPPLPAVTRLVPPAAAPPMHEPMSSPAFITAIGGNGTISVSKSAGPEAAEAGEREQPAVVLSPTAAVISQLRPLPHALHKGQVTGSPQPHIQLPAVLPSSPRPPVVRHLADAAGAAGATNAVAAAAATAAAAASTVGRYGGGAASGGAISSLGLVAAVMSPRRPYPMVSVPAATGPLSSPLRSPARWNLPSTLTPLPLPPSPPPPMAPRSPAGGVLRYLASPGGRYPGYPVAASPSAAFGGLGSSAATAINGARLRATTPPTSPRIAQLPLLPTSPSPRPTANAAAAAAAAAPVDVNAAILSEDKRSASGTVMALLGAPAAAGSPSKPATPAAVAPTVIPNTVPLLITAKPQLHKQHAAATAQAAQQPDATPPDRLAARQLRRRQLLQTHGSFFCVCPDDCNSMSVYYLGAFRPAAGAFDLGGALGPFRLDLGDIFYAPNTLADPEGRSLLWGWLQEKPRKVGEYDYAGCLSLPRLLYLEVDEEALDQEEAATASRATVNDQQLAPKAANPDGEQLGRRRGPPVCLVQRPPPELGKLRVPGRWWCAEGVLLEAGATTPVRLPASAASHFELELHMAPLPQPLLPQPTTPTTPVGEASPPMSGLSPQRGGASTPAAAAGVVPCPQGTCGGGGSRCSGVLLHSWRGGAEGGAALLYHWDSGVLEVVFEALDPHTLTFSLAAPGARRVGGPLLRPPASGCPLSLRVFLDYSCLEVFTGDGEVLTARVYRGVPPAPPLPGPRGSSSGGSASGSGSAAVTRRVSPLGTPRWQQNQAAALQALQQQGLMALPASPSAAAAKLPDLFNHEQGHHGPHHHLLTHDAYASGGAAAAGVELVSFGCATEFDNVAAYELGEIWADCV